MLVHVGRGQRAEGRMREEARGSRQVPALARPGWRPGWLHVCLQVAGGTSSSFH